MQRSFHCKLGNFLLLVFVASTVASQRLLVYRSDRAEIKTVTEKVNHLEWQAIDSSDDLFVIQYLRESAAEVAVLPNKISKLIVCDQPALNNRSIFNPHPLMARKRPGVTLLVEMQLEKDEVTALRSITTLERSKLDVIRQRVAKVLKDNLDIDSISIDGISVEGAIDLSKLAVLSDAPLLLPPFYGFDLDADKAFNLERDISSLYLYVYLPNTRISLLKDEQSNTLKSLLNNIEIHEQCVILAKNTRITIESGAVKSTHVTLEVPANTEVHVIEDCTRGDLCRSRALSGTTTNSEPIRTLTPVNMSMTRALHKIGFHRDLETKIQLLNVKDFDVNPEHCSLVLVETLSEDYYIDRDEVEGLERLQRNNHFDFFTQGIDIERPAYTSTQHVVVVTSSHKISRDESAVYTITYPVHMRYQMPTPTDETHRKTYINAPLVYLKCRNNVSNEGPCNVPPRIDQKFSPLSTGVQSNAQSTCSEVTWVPVEVNHVIEPLTTLIPLGQLQHSWFGTLVTLGTTFLAVSLLAGFVYKTTSSKCLKKQKDD